MIHICFGFLCLSLYLLEAHSYVLLQVRKDDQNRSKIDALIHKELSADQADRFAETIARKQFSERNRQQRINERIDEPESEDRDYYLRTRGSEEERVEKRIEETVRDFVKKKPVFRTKNFKLSPEVIHFRSKPSLMYELDSSTLIRAIKDFLSSNLVARYADDMAKKAANVYRNYNDG